MPHPTHTEEMREEFYKHFENGIFTNELSETEEQSAVRIADFFLSKFNDHLKAIKETLEKEERLRAFEILHKHAMETTNVQVLNVLEEAQKEILSDTAIKALGVNEENK